VDRTEPDQRLLKTIRLDEERIHKLLDGLDATSGAAPQERRSSRYKYRVKTLVVYMQQPGFAAPIPYLVIGRNISANGLAFLHGGYVHTQTRCVVQLATSYGTWDDVPATVVRCRYLEANVHEVAVCFDHPINPAAYCAEAVDNRVLLVDDDPSIARLTTFHLQQLNAQVDYAENGKVALERVARHVYDLILIDMDMPVMNGFTAVQEMRRRGYSGRIVAATGLTEPGAQERCLAAGCDEYIPKPYARADLAVLLESLRQEPLLSTFRDDASMKDLVQTFVAELPVRVRAIEACVVQQDLKRLQHLTRCLKGEGSGYGFDVITEAAGKLETAIIAGTQLPSIQNEINALVKLCMQARSAAQTPQPRGNQPGATAAPDAHKTP